MIVLLKIFEASYNIRETRYGTPVIFCREVKNQGSEESSIKIRFDQAYFICCATGNIVFIHIWKKFLEFKCQTLSHDANTVNRVYKSLCLEFKNVPY